MRQEVDVPALGRAVYGLLTSVVIPRPIAWVSTRSADGVDNLAPHSFFTISGVQPPVVQFTSVGEKDTLRNARATGEFVVCFVSEALADAANTTATDYPPGTSEVDAAGLTREPSRQVAPPRIAESPVALECRVVGEQSFGDCTVVFGEVVHLAVDEAVLRDGRPVPDLLRPASRLGSDQWGALGTITRRRRVPFAEVS